MCVINDSTSTRTQFRLNSIVRFLCSIRIVRVSLALAVAFWMAGAGCMLGCENMVTAAPSSEGTSPASSPAIVVSGEVCASMHSHDCCAKREAHASAKTVAKTSPDKPQFDTASRKKIPAQPNDNLKVIGQWNTGTSHASALSGTFPTMIDCPLAVNATAVLSGAGPDHSNVALPASSETASLSNSTERISAFGRPLRLPNRGHTYLLCCVFLI